MVPTTVMERQPPVSAEKVKAKAIAGPRISTLMAMRPTTEGCLSEVEYTYHTIPT